MCFIFCDFEYFELSLRLLLILRYFIFFWNVNLQRKYGENFVDHRVIFLSQIMFCDIFNE